MIDAFTLLPAFLSAPDMVIVMAVALVVFGPKRLPEVGRQLGGFIRDMKKTMGQFTDAVNDVREPFNDVGSTFRELRPMTGPQPRLRPLDQSPEPLPTPMRREDADHPNAPVTVAEAPPVGEPDAAVAHPGFGWFDGEHAALPAAPLGDAPPARSEHQ